MASNEALQDASAFLELEYGLPRQNLNGVEAAILMVNTSDHHHHTTTSSNTTTTTTSISTDKLLRINKASLDRIASAAASTKGGMATFGSNIGEKREEISLAMDEIRLAQVRIFHDHMKLDVFDTQQQDDTDDSEEHFLSNLQAAHEIKEKNMSQITTALTNLGNQISKINKKIAEQNAIPGDPIENRVSAPKMSFKNAALRVLETQKKEREKKIGTLRDMIGDAVDYDRIHHGGVLPNIEQQQQQDDSSAKMDI